MTNFVMHSQGATAPALLLFKHAAKQGCWLLFLASRGEKEAGVREWGQNGRNTNLSATSIRRSVMDERRNSIIHISTPLSTKLNLT